MTDATTTGAPAGNAGSDKPKFTIGADIPEAIRRIIERNETAGTPDNIADEIADKKTEDTSILQRAQGALRNALGGSTSMLGKIAEGMADHYVKYMILTLGIIVLAIGLIAISISTGKGVASGVAKSDVGKAGLSLLGKKGKVVAAAASVLK